MDPLDLSVGEEKTIADDPRLDRVGLHSVALKRNTSWWYPHGTHIAPTMLYNYVLEFRHYKKGNWAFSDEQGTYHRHTALRLENPRQIYFNSDNPRMSHVVYYP